MIAGIIVMIIAIFTNPPLWIIVIFEKSIYLLNLMIHAVASVDSFVIQNISFNSYYLLTFYLLIIGSIIWLKKPNFTKTIFVMSSVILVQLSFILSKIEIEKEKELIVYNKKDNSLISTRIGNTVVFYKRDTSYKNDSNDRIMNSYLVGNSASLSKIDPLKNLMYFKNKKILLIDSSGIYPPNLSPDLLILTQTPKINLDRLLTQIQPKMIIADGSNSNSIQKYWKESCLKKNIPFHSTKEKGYYKL
ncbi:hypothetical protein GCM10022250_13190 [Flavobacterium chungbukense]|uniref:ComEC/Rec2-related protein domain-containing protein n=2 Tax=Flavobacterium chungbukense TaxID=877464 RepID=A0ABP7XV04_9FLAO